MHILDCQLDYWNDVGPTKPFAHPVNFDHFAKYVAPDGWILDYGCGYGRVLGLLRDRGYQNLIGVDPAQGMIARALQRCPDISFRQMVAPPRVELADSSMDAVLLFTVLTCVPSDAGQRAIIREVDRVLRPGGLVYISDLWLQADPRNVERYVRDQPKHGTYGVFDLPEGVTVRHHDPRWLETLTAGYQCLSLDNLQVQTMNGHSASGFQWFGCKKGRVHHAVRAAPRVSANPLCRTGNQA